VSRAKIYVDEDAAEHALVSALRHRGIDIVTVVEAGQETRSDEDQLRFAAISGRALYSFNVSDFARLHREFHARSEMHSGIILIPRQRYSVGDKIRRVMELLDRADADALKNSLHFL
jgi:hypothetical protein